MLTQNNTLLEMIRRATDCDWMQLSPENAKVYSSKAVAVFALGPYRSTLIIQDPHGLEGQIRWAYSTDAGDLFRAVADTLEELLANPEVIKSARLEPNNLPRDFREK